MVRLSAEQVGAGLSGGDDVVACEKWCGLPPLLPVFWQKTMFTDCGFENAHPEDDGLHPPVLDIFPSAKDVLGNAMKYEPWRGWPFRTKYPMEFNDYGGLPPDNERQITKICCNKPLRKCLTIGEPTVVVRLAPILGLELRMQQVDTGVLLLRARCRLRPIQCRHYCHARLNA
ncbi:unnamed protein product [Durusdinium trenchii]|uniref:Uncharacterized protein n=1 Tax=Durusdinium trenchii TaxID=1381693 RepID=A0ABP0P5B1_9DINO